jgi:hypothetical protein
MTRLARRGNIAASSGAGFTPAVITLIQQVASDATTGSRSSLVATVGVTTTVGHVLILRALSNSQVTAVVDSQSNGWTVDSSQVSNGNWVTFASCTITVPLASSDTITTTLAATTSYHGLVVDEWSNISTTSRFGSASAVAAVSNTTSRATNSITVTKGALVLGVWDITGADASFAAGNGYTGLPTAKLTTAGNYSLEGEYAIDSGSGGTYAPAATGSSGTYRGAAAYYKAAPAP